MIDFCPSCGGIRSMSPDINLMNAHNRMCRCSSNEPSTPFQSASSGGIAQDVLTEERVRQIVREEVANALKDVKQELVHEVPQEMAKQVRARTGRQREAK